MKALTTAKKGFLLALIPCAVQVAVLIGLSAALFQEQRDAAMEADCRNIILQTQMVEKQMSDLVFVAVFYAEARGLLGRKLANTALVRAQEAAESAPEPRLHEAAMELIAVCEPLLEVGMMTGDTRVHELERAVPNASYKVISTGERFIQQQSAATADASLRNKQSRRRTRLVLAFAVILSVAVAGALSRFFVGDLLAKIQHLYRNSKALSQRRPLAPALQGSDEFAQFDNLLHNLDSELATAMDLQKRSFEESPQLIAVLDKNLRFKQCNAATVDLLGTRPEAIEESGRALFLPALEAGRTTSFEYTMRRKDGTEVGLLWSTCPSQDGEQLYCVAHDVTEAMRAEAEKRQYVAVLHDQLSSPIQRVEALLSRLLSSADAMPPDARADLEISRMNIERLRAMVTSMSDLDSASNATPDLASRSVSSLSALATAKNISVIVKPSDASVSADEPAVVRVLVNLVSNAIKFSPRSSEITIACEAYGPDHFRLSVHDQGPGVPPEFREKIFSPFGQAPNQPSTGQGVGLGLAICTNIIRAHAGQIGVDIPPEGGSRFWFTLPAAPSCVSS
jgi:PAS domain-containing protein